MNPFMNLVKTVLSSIIFSECFTQHSQEFSYNMIQNIYNFIKYLRLDLIHYQYCEQSECAVRVGPLKKMTLNILDRELISLDFSNCFLYSYSHSFFQFEAILKCAKHLRTSIKLHRLGWRPFEMEFDSKFVRV